MGVLKGWEAGEIGVHYATTLNIAPSKKSSKMGQEPEMQGYQDDNDDNINCDDNINDNNNDIDI